MAVKHDNPKGADFHRWVQDNLSAYIDGELSAPEIARLESHLDECAECAHSLETLRQTVAWVRALPTQRVPRSFAIPVSESREERSTLSWLLPYFRASAAVAAVFLIVTLSADLFRLTFTIGQYASAPAKAPSDEIALASVYPTAEYIELTPIPTSDVTMFAPPAQSREEASAAGSAVAPQGAGQANKLGLAVKPMATAQPLAPTVPELQISMESLYNDTEPTAGFSRAAPTSATTSLPMSEPLTMVVPSSVDETGAVSPTLTSSEHLTPPIRRAQGDRDFATLRATPRLVWRAIQGTLLLILVGSVVSILLLRKNTKR